MKWSDFLLGIIILLWLFLRQWPFGDTLQTYTDVFLLIAAISTIFNHWRKSHE